MNWKHVSVGIILAAFQSSAASEIGVYHGLMYSKVNEDRQLTLVLDGSASEHNQADGYADMVLQFAPMNGEAVPDSILSTQPLKDVTLERYDDGMVIVLGSGERYRFLVPQKIAEIAALRDTSADPVIPGIALSWYDVSKQQLDIEQAFEEFKGRSVID